MKDAMQVVQAKIAISSLLPQLFFLLLLPKFDEGIILSDRRTAISTVSSLLVSSRINDLQQQQQQAQSTFSRQQLDSLFLSKKVPWVDDSEDTVLWNQLRYASSTLRDSRRPSAAETLIQFPSWLEGNWQISYKFQGAKFPMGRDLLTLRVPGAGLATCLSLPNVGLNPPPFTIRFTLSPNGRNSFEDWPFNAPRKLEAFWPAAKTLYVQNAALSASPRCFDTGQGCLDYENPTLHAPSNRLAMGFEAPTRSSSRNGPLVQQTIEVTILEGRSFIERNSEYGVNDAEGCSAQSDPLRFGVERSFVQNNVEQELQTFYREFITLETPCVNRVDGVRRAKGRLRVAAFLPHEKSLGMEATSVSNEPIENQRAGPGPRLPLREIYDDRLAVAIYDYEIELRSLASELSAI